MNTLAALRLVRFAERPVGLALLALAALGSADAQLNVQWLKVKDAPNKLGPAPTALSDSTTEVDFGTGDLNKDGWIDVVVTRKEQSSTTGKRAQTLLMNNHGRLEDKTAQYAQASDVVGDHGFLTPVNNRDVKIIDVNGDTWPDVVTCTTLSDGDPKAISHPRVYMNLGNDGLGQWLGLRNEDARIPQLKVIGSNLAVAPRFCEVAAGDVTGDGKPDLYFIDYDDTETGIGEAFGTDLNDRLLINDGNGFFSDSLETRLTTAQLASAFGVKAVMVDANNDGKLDIVKDTTLGSPTAQRIFYNTFNNQGFFQPLGIQDVGSGSPYGIDMGDLNGDGLADLAGADDGGDVYQLSTGTDPLGRVTYGPVKNYDFLTGGDEGIGHNVIIKDLDNDGRSDVMITSVDVDFIGCFFGRLHIYHNLGNISALPHDITLREEVEFANGSEGTGWKGVVGITAADVGGSYDAAIADYDNDGDQDMLIGVCGGTHYWQSLKSADVCQTNLGFGGPGTAALSICGEDLTLTNSLATMQLTGAAPSSPLFIALGLVNSPTPLKGGMLVPVPLLMLISGFNTSALGTFSAPVHGNPNTPFTLYLQMIIKSGPTYQFTNALAVHLGV